MELPCRTVTGKRINNWTFFVCINRHTQSRRQFINTAKGVILAVLVIAGVYTILPMDHLKTIAKEGHMLHMRDKSKHVTAKDFSSGSRTPVSNPAIFDDTQRKRSKQQQMSVDKIDETQTLEQKCLTEDFLVYLCDSKKNCEGLGDRMKGMASVYVLSKILGRNLQIVHEKPALCPLNQFFDHNLYNWHECIPFLSKSGRETASNLVNFKDDYFNSISSLNISDLAPKNVSYIRTNRFWLRQLVKRDDVKKVFPEFVRENDSPVAPLYHHILQQLFKPKDEILADVTEFLQKHQTGSQLVCAHIRSWRANVTRATEFLKRYFGNKNYTIYVASDLEKSKVLAKRMLGDNLIVSDKRIIHVDRPVSPKEGVIYVKDPKQQCDGLYAAIWELTLLSRCDILYITASGFGLAAAAMRETPSKDLYCYRDEGTTFSPCTLEYALTNFIIRQ